MNDSQNETVYIGLRWLYVYTSLNALFERIGLHWAL